MVALGARDSADHAIPSTALGDASRSAGPIDRAHLTRMTYGDRDLECEVLRLFATQTDLLLGRMRDAPPPAVSAMAHTLAGSARSVGAWQFAAAAAAVESAAAAGSDLVEPLARLSAAAHDAQMAVAELLRT